MHYNILDVICFYWIWGCTTYNVRQQEMIGRAEFAKTEQNRRILIEEAAAILEAEKLNAQAEVERAKKLQKPLKLRMVRFLKSTFNIYGLDRKRI